MKIVQWIRDALSWSVVASIVAKLDLLFLTIQNGFRPNVLPSHIIIYGIVAVMDPIRWRIIILHILVIRFPIVKIEVGACPGAPQFRWVAFLKVLAILRALPAT